MTATSNARFRMFELILEWDADNFRLELYDTGVAPKRPRTICETYLAYRFYDAGQLIFEGEHFLGSPLHAIDSQATLAALLGWLSLRPGDTDAEYFDAYTPEQLAWCVDRAETLSMLALEIEQSEED